MEEYIVYVKTDEHGFIIEVNSSAFIEDIAGWIEIDRGFSVHHCHAQGNYIPESIMTESGVWRYKLEGGKPVECTAGEIAAQEAAVPMPPMSDKERIAELEAALELLLSGVTE